jgi:hypothetical protein
MEFGIPACSYFSQKFYHLPSLAFPSHRRISPTAKQRAHSTLFTQSFRPLKRIKPSCDVFICNNGVVERRNSGPSAAADRFGLLNKMASLSNKHVRY